MRFLLRGTGLPLCVLLLASPALADLTIVMQNGPGSGPGGEFHATPAGFPLAPVALTANGYFETFCIEKTEHIGFGNTYYVNLNTQAVAGGGGPNPDPLNSETAYLYEEFVTGQLGNYDYVTAAGRQASANALQDVIWYFEQEQGLTWVIGDNSLRDKYYQDAINNHSPGDIGNVMVMNLYADPERTILKQDQLVLFTERIPAPGAAALAMFGMGMIGWVRRRQG